MRISSALCDIHLAELRPMESKTLSPLGDVNTVYTWGCSVPGCHRNYHPTIFGYHDVVRGKQPDVGEYWQKPKCGLGHPVEFMVLTELAGTLTWACPNEDCDRTQMFLGIPLSAADIQQALKIHEYMWSGDGRSLGRSIALGHGKIPGPLPGQEIWINNLGLPERPDWRYVIYQDRQKVCINWHFGAAQAALLHALEWAISKDQRPRLRLISMYRGHVAYTVDGLTNGESVHVVEMAPGKWLKREILADGKIDWFHDERWLTAMHALTL